MLISLDKDLGEGAGRIREHAGRRGFKKKERGGKRLSSALIISRSCWKWSASLKINCAWNVQSPAQVTACGQVTWLYQSLRNCGFLNSCGFVRPLGSTLLSPHFHSKRWQVQGRLQVTRLTSPTTQSQGRDGAMVSQGLQRTFRVSKRDREYYCKALVNPGENLGARASCSSPEVFPGRPSKEESGSGPNVTKIFCNLSP